MDASKVLTDTIYGVACLACNKSALDKIYSMKGRDLAKPLGINISFNKKVSTK